METRPLLDFGAGYVQRALGSMPRQGTAAPWLMSMDYFQDVKTLRRAAVVDEHLRFADAGSGATPSGPDAADGASRGEVATSAAGAAATDQLVGSGSGARA